jgi:preprotein translocase subunit SecD
MTLRSKFLVVFLLLVSVLYANYPNFLEFVPGLKSENVDFYKEKTATIQEALEALHALDLFLVDTEKEAIQVIGSDSSKVRALLEIDLFDDVFEDLKVVEEAGEYLLTSSTKNLTNIASDLNQLVLNAKRVEKVEFDTANSEILFFANEESLLFKNLEPIRSFIGDELDFFEDVEKNAYSSKKKDPNLLIHLGLDLKGGIYLDLGIDIDKIFENLAINLREDLTNYFLDEGIYFSDIELAEDKNSLNVYLASGQSFDWQQQEIQDLLGDFEIETEEEGIYRAFLAASKKTTIEENSLEQVINILNNRVNLLGVKEPSIQRKGEDAIVVQLPGQTDPARARNVIQQSAKLDFRMVEENISPDAPGDNLVFPYEQKDSLTGEIINIEEIVVEDRVILSGEMVKEARVAYSQTTAQPYVTIDFNSEGGRLFAAITEKNVGRSLAIILDGKVQSFPRINEAIYGGSAQITGDFSNQEAADLALVLRSGYLPTSLIINEERTVGASLGEDSIRASMIALLLGFVFVILLLLIYYQLAGLFCIFALLFNILIIFAALSYFQATLTLPGMAGIILTVGMAVDANILIFERIKEELGLNTNLHKAIGQGYQRSLWTILDANITTLLASLILFQFGTGPIKGFAVTLSIGIVASLFTSLFVSRFLFELFYKKAAKNQKLAI